MRNMRRFIAPAMAATVLSVLNGCGGGNSGNSSGTTDTNLPPAVAAAMQRSTTVDSRIVTADNTFGFNVFQELAKSDTGKNVFISPTSIALALQIASNGAKGTTLTAFASTLQFNGLSVADVNNANAALQASLVSPDPQVQLTISNSLWTRDNAVQPDFITANQTYYDSELGKAADAPDAVNAWVNSKTNGKISTILSGTKQDYADTVAIIVNAIYFKGAWSTKFDTALTANGTFTKADGTRTTAPFMNQTGDFGYYKGASLQAIRLPYGTGRLSMIVVLPDAGISLDTFLPMLTPDNWNTWVSHLTTQYGTLALPRFTSQYSKNLVSSLTDLGMGIAFDPQNSDLSGLAILSAGDHAYINFIVHKTYLAVDETGTTAAATTGVGIGVTGVSLPSFQMRMERPFFCAIRDEKTGTILFMGIIADPTQT